MPTDTRSAGNGTSTRHAQGRRTVATYSRYADAERAVDYLSDHDFPVERVAIVGQDISFVEQVTGRVGLLDATLRGGAIGAITGLLIGWLFAVFSWFDPIVAWGWLILDAVLFASSSGPSACSPMRSPAAAATSRRCRRCGPSVTRSRSTKRWPTGPRP